MSIINRTGILTLALAVVLAAGGSVAFAKGHKNKHSGQNRPVRGTVTAADSNSVTIETQKHESKKFTITSSTTIERLGKHGKVKPPKEARSGKHGKAQKARKIKAGCRIVITAKDGVAEKVAIKRNRHKGKSR